MKSTAIFHLAAALLSLSSQTLASPVDTTITSRGVSLPRAQMTYNDQFSKSGLKYEDWVDDMVSQGKMHRANSSETTISARGVTTWLNGVACGYIIGAQNLYADAQYKFCSDMHEYYYDSVRTLEMIFSGGLCNGDSECILVARLTAISSGILSKIAIGNFCDAMFEELYNACPSNAGGTAQAAFISSDGVRTADIQMQFFENDPGATCPAPTLAEVCKKVPF